MTLTIDLYCNDGSPLDVTPPMIYDRGVGGAELSLMTWAETMTRRGHRIRIYNQTNGDSNHGGVEYLLQSKFLPHEKRDVFIAYRSPNDHLRFAKADVKLHWSMDQYTVGNFAHDIFPFVHRVICISPFHVRYHKEKYGIEESKIGYIDLGVRIADYDRQIEKVPGRCIWCSIPGRGLSILRVIWPKIKALAPHASLVITSDWTLWGGPSNIYRYRMDFLHAKDVTYLGAIPRHELIEQQLAAECQPFSCTYDELFCISAAECQVANAYPVTSPIGALETTNQWGTIVYGNPMVGEWQNAFAEEVAKVLNAKRRKPISDKARKRFDWEKICDQWERLIETGEF